MMYRRSTLTVLFSLALGASLSACRPRQQAAQTGQSDTAFASMQSRGEVVMGVDQYTSAHVFEDLPDGGRIVLDRDDASDRRENPGDCVHTCLLQVENA